MKAESPWSRTPTSAACRPAQVLVHIWQHNRRLLRHLAKELVRRKQGDSDEPPERSPDVVLVRNHLVGSPHAWPMPEPRLTCTNSCHVPVAAASNPSDTGCDSHHRGDRIPGLPHYVGTPCLQAAMQLSQEQRVRSMRLITTAIFHCASTHGLTSDAGLHTAKHASTEHA